MSGLAMTEISAEALRNKTVEVARRHKASWIELGQCLYAVYKDKHYRGWSFLNFDTYCSKELGIRQTTASKLLKSYYFLEKEEPRLAEPKYSEEASPARMPNYESVNLLRLARENKNIEARDFATLREDVIEKAREPKEVRTKVKKMLADSAPAKNPNDEKRDRRNKALKRLLTFLKSTKMELESEKLVPAYLIKQINDLSEKLQDQIEE